MKYIYLLAFVLTVLQMGCSSPGISSPNSKIAFSGNEYYQNGNLVFEVENVNEENILSINSQNNFSYKIASGDKLNVTVWGMPEAFPVTNFGVIDNPMSTRTVNSDGSIFFPYTGLLQVSGLTINETRDLLTKKLSEKFIDPQVDVTVVDFNENRTVYIVGEILSPSTFKIGIESLTLMDAIGRSKGLNPNTSSAKEIYIMRDIENDPKVFRVDLSTSDRLLLAHKFLLKPKDVVFVGPSKLPNGIEL